MYLTEKERTTLDELRHNADFEVEAGSKWRMVYLDNCPGIRNRKSFNGVLSALTKKKYFRNEDGIWGQVFVGDRHDGD